MYANSALRVSDYEAGAVMAPHCHDEPTLSVIVGGDFSERIGSSNRHYASGTVTFAPAGVVHSQQFGKGGARQIIMWPEAAWLAYLRDCRVDLDASPFARAAALQELGRKLFAEMRRDDEFSPLGCQAAVLEIVAAFGRASTGAGAVAPRWLRTARDFLHDNACAPLDMKEIAHAAGRHEIHLAREFRRYFGVSVGTYLRQLRTERAAHLLRHSQSSVVSIAQDCGFASHAHLCRVFKEHYGVTPSQYRDN